MDGQPMPHHVWRTTDDLRVYGIANEMMCACDALSCLADHRLFSASSKSVMSIETILLLPPRGKTYRPYIDALNEGRSFGDTRKTQHKQIVCLWDKV